VSNARSQIGSNLAATYQDWGIVYRECREWTRDLMCERLAGHKLARPAGRSKEISEPYIRESSVLIHHLPGIRPTEIPHQIVVL